MRKEDGVGPVNQCKTKAYQSPLIWISQRLSPVCEWWLVTAIHQQDTSAFTTPPVVASGALNVIRWTPDTPHHVRSCE